LVRCDEQALEPEAGRLLKQICESLARVALSRLPGHYCIAYVTGNAGRKLTRVPQTAQTDHAAELAIGDPVHHLAHGRHWRPIEQAFNDPICPGEPLEKTLGVCADFIKMLLPDPMLRLRTGFRRPAGCQRAFGGSLELNSGPPRVILRRAAPATVLPVYPQQRKSLRNAGTAGQCQKRSSGRGHRDGSTHGASWRAPYCEEVAASGGRVN
jgi:hypothetical protein